MPILIRILQTLLILIVISPHFLLADTIQLRQGNVIYGQLYNSTETKLHIEVLETDGQRRILAVDPAHVYKITDESGTVLFSRSRQIPNFKSYYNPMMNNWEELQDLFTKKAATLHFPKNNRRQVRIISITAQFVFSTDLSAPDTTEKQTVIKTPIQSLNAINTTAVIVAQNSGNAPLQSDQNHFPVYNLSVGIGYAITAYDELQHLFRDYYNQNQIDAKAQSRQSDYPGIFVGFNIYLIPDFSFGFNGYKFTNKSLNALNIGRLQARYHFSTMPLKPWVELGLAGHSFSSTEKTGDSKHRWKLSKSALTFGAGIVLNQDNNINYTLSVLYAPFGKEQSNLLNNTTVERTINSNMVLIHLGVGLDFQTF